MRHDVNRRDGSGRWNSGSQIAAAVERQRVERVEGTRRQQGEDVMRALVLAAAAAVVLSVQVASTAKAEDTTVIKKDTPYGDSKTVIKKKDQPFEDKKVIIHHDNE
jgi:hypothetical protein